MGAALNLIGERFGRLVVVDRYPIARDPYHRWWMCKCDCGADTISETSALRMGVKKSCGCLHQEIVTKHGMRKSHLHNVWANIKYSACKRYGVVLYPEWDDFKTFMEWAFSVGYKEDPKMTLKRKDRSLGFHPDNCIWVSR